MLQNLDFDFSLFEDVPSPKSHNTVCRLTLAAEDRLSQNEAFHRALQGDHGLSASSQFRWPFPPPGPQWPLQPDLHQRRRPNPPSFR